MVKIDHLNQSQTNQTETNGSQTFGSQKCGLDNSTNPKNQTPTKSENKSGLITTLGSLLPFAPLVFEQFTGQKVPQLSGTMAEIQSALQQVQFSLQTVLTNQQTLSQRITNLETNAVQQLTSLTHQFKSLRLTHTKEQKQIEYNNPPSLETENNY